jgi:hypothetical protein
VVENLYWNLGKWHWHGFKNLEVGIFKKITNNKFFLKENMDIFKNILSLEIKIS